MRYWFLIFISISLLSCKTGLEPTKENLLEITSPKSFLIKAHVKGGSIGGTFDEIDILEINDSIIFYKSKYNGDQNFKSNSVIKDSIIQLLLNILEHHAPNKKALKPAGGCGDYDESLSIENSKTKLTIYPEGSKDRFYDIVDFLIVRKKAKAN